MKKLALTAYILIISGCDFAAIEMPSPAPSPSPTPSPVPTVSPEPEPEIIPALLAPRFAPTHSPVTISLCAPYVAGTKLIIDGSVLLGTFGENRMSGCMQLVYPGFSASGERTLSVGNLTHKIKIVDSKTDFLFQR